MHRRLPSCNKKHRRECDWKRRVHPRRDKVRIGQEEEEIPLKDEATSTPDAMLLEAELQIAIEKAITLLPETQRMALVLRRYEELSYEEIADVLDLSVPAVKSLLFRARTELRERLRNYLES